MLKSLWDFFSATLRLGVFQVTLLQFLENVDLKENWFLALATSESRQLLVPSTRGTRMSCFAIKIRVHPWLIFIPAVSPFRLSLFPAAATLRSDV